LIIQFNINIHFGKKITSVSLNNLIERWDDILKTDEKETIIFDLQEIEWISLEELTFLFAGFRYLLSQE
jgi:hypothetical protein